MECLKNIVGISNRPCLDCSDTSRSGLYVDDRFESISLLKVKAAISCNDEVYMVLKDALEKAITEFPMNLSSHIEENHDPALAAWSGVIGRLDKADKVLTGIAGNWYAVSFSGIGPRSMQIKLTNPGLYLSNTGPVDLKLYADGVLQETFTISTTGRPSVFEGVKTLPAYDRLTGQKILYTLAYELPPGATYRETTWRCGCNDTLPWEKYVDFGSYTGSDLSEAKLTRNNRMFGIFFNLSVSCGLDWICSDWDFKSSDWGMTMAKAIQLTAILNTHRFFLNSDNINAFTVADPEAIIARIGELQNEITYRYNFLGFKLPLEGLECWRCRQTIRKGEILV